MAAARFCPLLLVAGILAAGAGTAAAQTLINQEYKLKAAFLYNFGRYVQWPESPKTISIGVLGKDPFGESLREIEQVGTVGDKKIVVQRFSSAADCKPCHILFISRQAAEGHQTETVDDRLKAALEKCKGLSVLLVGETEGFARKGAVINFSTDVQANMLKMEINQDAAKRAGLKISSDLLGLQVVSLLHDKE